MDVGFNVSIFINLRRQSAGSVEKRDYHKILSQYYNVIILYLGDTPTERIKFTVVYGKCRVDEASSHQLSRDSITLCLETRKKHNEQEIRATTDAQPWLSSGVACLMIRRHHDKGCVLV